MKHVVCFSGGHSSALVAIEVVRRFGSGEVILLNHDINPRVEDADVKRFKRDIAGHLGLPITHANYRRWSEWDQFDVCMYHSAFKAGDKTALCTHRLKTEPFQHYLAEQFPNRDCIIYYGFDASEGHRIQRRAQILGAQGYATDFPLARWERTIRSTREIGVEPPMTYSLFRHANCVGCLKAGRQHWYVVFCTRPDIWEKAKSAEDDIGYTIIKGVSMVELEPLFMRMRCAGVEATEKLAPQTFWARVRAAGINTDTDPVELLPCECTEAWEDPLLNVADLELRRLLT